MVFIISKMIYTRTLQIMSMLLRVGKNMGCGNNGKCICS